MTLIDLTERRDRARVRERIQDADEPLRVLALTSAAVDRIAALRQLDPPIDLPTAAQLVQLAARLVDEADALIDLARDPDAPE